MQERVSYNDSCKILQSKHLLEAGEIPVLPQQMPRHDDEILGLSFFRTRLAAVALDGLTLPRTFFGRSEIQKVSFHNTDLSESTANWNDFIDVDFSSSNLSGSDLRASIFDHVNFQRAILRNADLRRASFRNCIFSEADMNGTKLCRSFIWLFRLSQKQRSVINWQSPGPEPEGG